MSLGKGRFFFFYEASKEIEAYTCPDRPHSQTEMWQNSQEKFTIATDPIRIFPSHCVHYVFFLIPYPIYFKQDFPSS